MGVDGGGVGGEVDGIAGEEERGRGRGRSRRQ